MIFQKLNNNRMANSYIVWQNYKMYINKLDTYPSYMFFN